jgi:hypothetical protein
MELPKHHGTSRPRAALLSYPGNRQDVMSANDEVAESAFDKNKRREAEINSALQQEHARHEAVIKNMHRLRSLRLKREAQSAPAKRKSH